MFNDLRRSNAVMKLALTVRNGLISDEEIKKFTDETRAIIARLGETSLRCGG